MRCLGLLVFFACALLMNGCDSDEPKQEHIYSTQKKVLDQAKKVDLMSEDLEKKRQQALKDQ